MIIKIDKFIIDSSQKSGCTTVLKSWLSHSGLLQKALDYHPWVHKYREDFNMHPSQEDLLSQNFIKIKYVRDPIQRAISSYIHGINVKKTTEDFFNFKNLNPSFLEFLQFLRDGKISMTEGGLHWQVQNELPSIDYQEIIKIEDIHSQTKYLNTKYNLNLKIFDSFHHMKKGNHIEGLFNQPASEVDNAIKKTLIKTHEFNSYPKGNQKIKDKLWKRVVPSYDSFINEEVINLIKRIYKTDFDRFNY